MPAEANKPWTFAMNNTGALDDAEFIEYIKNKIFDL